MELLAARVSRPLVRDEKEERGGENHNIGGKTADHCGLFSGVVLMIVTRLVFSLWQYRKREA